MIDMIKYMGVNKKILAIPEYQLQMKEASDT